jgi:hypothetical protein
MVNVVVPPLGATVAAGGFVKLNSLGFAPWMETFSVEVNVSVAVPSLRMVKVTSRGVPHCTFPNEKDPPV